MTDQVLEKPQATDDPWAVADNAKPRDFEYFGQVKADCWFGFFPGEDSNGKKQKPIPFDPAQHPVDKRATMIEIQIIPIPEQNVSFDIRQNYTDFSPDWTKITLPSIKALGLDGIRALNGHYVRVAQVDGKQKKKDDNGNKTGEFYKTFKFVELYQNIEECQMAYSGSSPTPTEQQPPLDSNDAEKETAWKFSQVVVENSVRGRTDMTEIRNLISTQIANMPMINKFFTVDSPEIIDLINKLVTK